MSLFHHLSIMNKARGNGTLFPSVGQQTTEAPLGSNEAPIGSNWWHRLSKEVYWFRHSTHNLSLQDWPVMHIVHLTDIHLRNEGPFLDRVIVEVTGLQPDLIVLTGDLITKGWTHRAIERFLMSLGEVPKLAIVGNWEHWVGGNLHDWKQLLYKYGVQLLVEEVITIRIKQVDIQVIGTDDHLAGQSNPNALLSKLNSGPTLCLTHSPAHFTAMAHPPVDLVLAGHAHGGQVRIPKLGALWVPKGTDEYIAGWYNHNNTHLFVSRGMGWSVAPLRGHCPPEIAHIFIQSTSI